MNLLKEVYEIILKIVDTYKVLVQFALIVGTWATFLLKIYHNPNHFYWCVIFTLIIIWWIFYSLINKKVPSTIQPEHSLYKYAHRGRYLSLITVVVAVGLVFSIHKLYVQHQDEKDKIIVLIFPFKNESDSSKDIFSTQLFGELNEQLDTDKSIKIELMERPISENEGGVKSAKAIAKQKKASILIWGWYTKSLTNVYLKTKFEMLDSSLRDIKEDIEVDNKNGAYKIKQLNTFELQTELTNANSFLTFCSIGYIKSVQFKWQESISYLSKALNFKSSNSNLGKANFFLGFSYWKLKENDIATNYLINSLKYNNSSLTYSVLGTIYSDNNQFALAMNCFDEAITLDPFNYMAYNNKAVLYTKQKKYDLALENYMRAFALDFNNDIYSIMANMNKIYILRGRIDSAVDVNKNNYKGFYRALLRRIDYNFNSQNYKKVLADVDTGIKLYPDSSVFYILRGDVEDDGEHNRRAALKDYSLALKWSPNNSHVYYDRAVVYKRLGELKNALKDYNKSISIRPSAEAYNNRGDIYMTWKMYKNAYDEFRLAAKISSSVDSSAYYDHMRMAEYLMKK